MKKLITICSIVGMLLLTSSAIAVPTYVETVDVYTVVDTRTPVTSVSWNHTYDGSADPIAWATLSIVAEGVDTGEDDAVWFDGHFLGYLQQQSFYNPLFDLQLGPGALGSPQTELTTSTFLLDPSWIVPLMTATVQVDISNWIMEVETSTLTVAAIPAPGAILLGSIGISFVGWLKRRRSL